MNIKKEEIYNEETGDVLFKNRTYLPEMFNEDGYYFWGKKRQSRQFTGFDVPLDTYEEKGIFGDLCRFYLADGSNFLEVRTKRQVRPFNSEDLAKMLGVSRRQANRRLAKFYERDVIRKIEIGNGKTIIETWIVVNPLYFIAGKRINDSLYKIFRHCLDEHLSEYAKREFAKRCGNDDGGTDR